MEAKVDEEQETPVLVPNDTDSEDYWEFWRRITDLYEEG